MYAEEYVLELRVRKENLLPKLPGSETVVNYLLFSMKSFACTKANIDKAKSESSGPNHLLQRYNADADRDQKLQLN